MRKSNYLGFMVMLTMLVCSLGFQSCSGDEENDPAKERENYGKQLVGTWKGVSDDGTSYIYTFNDVDKTLTIGYVNKNGVIGGGTYHNWYCSQFDNIWYLKAESLSEREIVKLEGKILILELIDKNYKTITVQFTKQ